MRSESSASRWERAKTTRFQTLFNLSRKVEERYLVNLHIGRALEVTELYVKALQQLIEREALDQRVQHHKIAGLMMHKLILVQPFLLNDQNRKSPFLDSFQINSLLAVEYGVGITFENFSKGVRALYQDGYDFINWKKKLYQVFLNNFPTEVECIQIFDAFATALIPTEKRHG